MTFDPHRVLESLIACRQLFVFRYMRYSGPHVELHTMSTSHAAL